MSDERNPASMMQSVDFIEASDLFADHNDVWTNFTQGDIKGFTWGTNNRSLISLKFIREEMDKNEVEVPDDLSSLFDWVGNETLIDMEN